MKRWTPNFRISNLSLGFIFVICCGLFFFPLKVHSDENGPEDIDQSGAILIKEMITADNCESLCFFGNSLAEKTYEQTRKLLETHPLTQDATFDFQEDNIDWTWSETATLLLTSGRHDHLNPYLNMDLNVIIFSRELDGKVSSVTVALRSPLYEIIEVFGDNFLVYPLGAVRNIHAYGIVYDDLPGVFEVHLDCNQPELTSHTDIVRYYYSYTPDLRATGTIWEGYGTQLPDCSAPAFQPG